jgi:AbrB family looped-hinge helix DNA binding protein
MADPVEAAITAKGQATIPKAIRERLGVKPGDRIKFFVHPDGSVVLLPKRPVSELRGIVKARQRSATIEDVLVRYLAQDDPAQSRRATEFIERRLSLLDPAVSGTQSGSANRRSSGFRRSLRCP